MTLRESRAGEVHHWEDRSLWKIPTLVGEVLHMEDCLPWEECHISTGEDCEKFSCEEDGASETTRTNRKPYFLPPVPLGERR